MAADLKRVLGVIFAGLGLGPVPADPAEAESFELDGATCTVAWAPSGTEVTVSLEVGQLQQDPHAAADRLRRIMGLTLGLAMVNRAALVVEGLPDEQGLRALQSGRGHPLLFRAMATVASDRREEVFAALQDVVQLRSLALPHLLPVQGGVQGFEPPRMARDGGATREGDGAGSFVIFQP